MGKISLKCENCGSTLNKIETKEDEYICLHCGSKQLIKSDVVSVTNNYQVNQNITKIIYGNDMSDDTKLAQSATEYDKLIQNGEAFLKLENFSKALKCFKQAVQLEPSQYYACWMCCKVGLMEAIEQVKINSDIEFDYDEERRYYERAVKLVDGNNKALIITEYNKLIDELESLQNHKYENEDLQAMAKKYRKMAIIFSIALGIFILIGLTGSGLVSYLFMCISLIFIVICSVYCRKLVNINMDINILKIIVKNNKLKIDALYQNSYVRKVRTLRTKERFYDYIENLLATHLPTYKVEGEYITRTNK